jgi:uncharacterized membrane-anchored protein
MTTRFGTSVVVLAVIQTLILVWMVSERMSILRSTNVVTLVSEPVDPRDIFRGDYVTLAYGISRVSLDTTPGDKDFDIGSTVYVEIRPLGETWRPAAIYRSYPDKPAEGDKVIRGRIVDMARGTPRMRPIPGSSEMESIPCPLCTTAIVSYGIESYFVPEGQGHAMEQERNASALSVDVALAKDGEAAIKGLRIDGEPIYEEPLL